MGDPNAEAAKRVRREMRDAMDDDVVEVGDEDEVRWEEEQVRRGGGGVDEPAVQPKTYTSAKSEFPIVQIVYPALTRIYIVPAVRPLPTTTVASTRLQTSLSYLTSSSALTGTQKTANERELVRLEEQERDVRREVERVEAKREWMEGFVGWVELLAGFLEDKVRFLAFAFWVTGG